MKFKILGSILILSLLQCGHLLAQSSRVVQGSVLSKADNEPMIGAYVLVKDASERVLSATITDFSGQFVTQVKSETNILDVSFLGFITQTITVGKQSNFTILIVEDKHEINEVQIVGERVMNNGGFSIPQREVATAVQTFNLKDLEGVQSTSLDEALQGRIAGLDIVSNSGDLGAGSSMRIRGTSSINAGSEPLIVVNDIIYDTEIESSFDFSSSTDEQYASMLSINPDDIESISVLKDAASTAIWGSRGANGVISIQTKKGVRGPTKIQYS
ncbi:MAG: TonB-dependent receptor plug domain-containing protein, partial [Bacteroidales bacterium]|nr:TonB-dependent receptor plug domain-containing protein [Bacteroidales bacterium]